jgi:hypothetical protein
MIHISLESEEDGASCSFEDPVYKGVSVKLKIV